MSNRYLPYLDSSMASLVGNRPYVADIRAIAAEKADKAYRKAIEKSSIKGMYDGSEYGDGLITARGMVQDPRYKYLMARKGSGMIPAIKGKYKLSSGTKSRFKNILSKKMTSGKPISYMSIYKKLTKGEGIKLKRVPDETDDQYESRKLTKRRLLKSLYSYMRRAKKKYGLTIADAPMYKKKMRKYKKALKEVDPSYMYKSRATPGTATSTGSGADGGFLGALLSTAAPMIMEGVKWIASKIGQKIKSRGKGGVLDFQMGMPRKSGYPRGTPGGRYHFWWKVYKLVSKEIPLYFPKVKDADDVAQQFMKENWETLMMAFKKTHDKMIAEQTTVGTVIDPLVSAIAAKENVPPEAVAEILKTPELMSPAGSGVVDTAISILSSPEAKAAMSSIAKNVLPKVLKGLASFAKGKFLKFLSKRPKLQKAYSSISEAVESPMLPRIPSSSTMPTTPLSESQILGNGIFGTTADLYNNESVYASAVDMIAKK